MNNKDFFDLSLDIMCIINDNNKIENANSSWEITLGYNENDLIGKKITDFVHPKDFNKILEDIHKLKQDKKIANSVNRFLKKNGNYCFLEWRATFHNNKIYAIAREITEDLQKFDSIFQGNPAIMFINCQKNKKLVEINEAFTKILGYKKEDIVGRNFRDLKFISKELDIDNIDDSFKKHGTLKNAEVIYVTKNDKIRHGLLSGEVIENQGEKCYLYTMIDITEQKKISEELKYKNQFLSILMEISFKSMNYPTDNPDGSINESLQIMGEFVGADRVYIFDYNFRNDTSSNTYEWCSEGVEPQIDNLQNIPNDMAYSWIKMHKEGNIINVPKVSKYKTEDKMKEILESQSIKSILTVPMMDGGNCTGFVGFDSVLKHKNYSQSEIDLLKLFAQAIVDMRKKDMRDKELVKSVEEKSILMREIHHRTKNNLQLVSSLLYLQSSYIDDPKVKKALKDTVNRVKSMAILHEKIYKTKNFNHINFKEYIEDIIKELIRSYRIHKKIIFYSDIENIDLSIDKSINCGLIVNELITNSIQHAFNNSDKGIIKTYIYAKGEEIYIEISDDGEGFKGNYDFLTKQSLGLQIVESLVSQLKGTVEKKDVQGTKFIIKFEKSRL